MSTKYPPPQQFTERNRALVADKRAGMTYRELTDKYHVSIERSRQIVREQREREEREERMARPRMDDYLDNTPVRDLPLSSWAINCLENAGLRTVEAVRRLPDKKLKDVPNLGPKCFREIRELVPYRDPDGPLTQLLRDPALQAAAGVANEIVRERYRQMRAEGWTLEHDDGHTDRSLAQAASAYAWHAALADDDREMYACFMPRGWPGSWHFGLWKPKDRRRDLVRAAALIVAEIERLDREHSRGT
jgi:hypothetical protein